MSLPVFLTESGALSALGPGGRYTLTGPEAHHAAGVMRVAAGEQLQLVDGAGARVTAQVAAVEPGPALELTVTGSDHEPRPAPRLVLVQALAKGGRDELAVEAGTEVGADLIVPWQAERCVARWRGPKATKGVAKWRQNTATATKQSRRAHLPEVADLHDSSALVAAVRSAVADGDVVLLAHEEAARPIADVPWGPRAGRVWLVVGPEGGISPQEVSALQEAGATTVTLGQHVLRASTAGPVGLALLAERRRRLAGS